MSVEEFRSAAEDAHRSLAGLSERAAIIEACRGSADPASLAWLAEGCGIGEDTMVLDLGGGLGGPAAWLRRRYRCRVLLSDPVGEAVGVASETFRLPGFVASGSALAVRDDGVDVVWMLGVWSVVPTVSAVLAEAARVGGTLGAVVFASTTPEAVEVAGSSFPDRHSILDALAASGWSPVSGPHPSALPAPPGWQDTGEEADDGDEAQVSALLAKGRIEPLVLVARR